MSNFWITAVFDRSRSRGGARLVALALADRADEFGECWPAVADVARRAGLASERAARKALRALIELGELSIDSGGGKHRTNRYRLLLAGDKTRNSAQGFENPEQRAGVSAETRNRLTANPERRAPRTLRNPNIPHPPKPPPPFRGRGVEGARTGGAADQPDHTQHHEPPATRRKRPSRAERDRAIALKTLAELRASGMLPPEECEVAADRAAAGGGA